MKPKIVSFKFTKKQTETKGNPSKTKKNYENIFNDILSGKKLEKNSKYSSQNDNKEQKSSIINKKNKIKFISKIDKTNISKEISPIPNNINILTEECEKNNNEENNIIFKTNKMNNNNNNEKCINITDKNESIKEQNKTSFIDEYVSNKSKEKIRTKQKEIKKQNKKEQNKTAEQELILLINQEKNNKKNSLYKKDKQYNYIKSVRTMNSNNKLNKNIREINNNNIKSKKNSIQKSSNRLYQYKRNISQKNKYNAQTFKKNKNESKERDIKPNITKNDNKYKKISSTKTNNLALKNNKMRPFNTFDKIIITNDIKKESNYKDYISINNTIKKKKLILNNTNSNINININITNINDKNSKKDASSSKERKKQSKLNTENNYNSNITTVNIINNNNISKKNSNNDYRLMFYNHSTSKHLPYQTKISSKGIKIESIDINLSEENDPPSKRQKFKFKKNLKKNNINKSCKVISENNDSKEVQSEYEHFRDIDDFWSNKSSTSYSCKSGFTVMRKLRSLSRERDKFKMMNNLKNFDKNKMDKIEDKLMNIVNKFHKDNVINNMNKKRRSNIIMKYKKNNFNTEH